MKRYYYEDCIGMHYCIRVYSDGTAMFHKKRYKSKQHAIRAMQRFAEGDVKFLHE